MSTPDTVTFETFDPNKPDRSNVWGIYNDHTFKTKSNRPAALNALQSTHRGKLFELVGGTWTLRATKDPLDLTKPGCEHCGVSLVKASTRYNYKKRSYEPTHDYIDAKWTWKRKSGRITSPPELLRLCSSCVGWYR